MHPIIHTKPIYSCPAEQPADLRMPEGWTPAWHQLETLKALEDPHIQVVINTAMTGDGKSLAAYLKTLQGGDHTAIGLYPTNELARDQMLQLQGYRQVFAASDLRIVRLSGPDLEAYAEQEELKRRSALSTLADQTEILLTNPDLFHYLHRGAYITPKDSPDRLWNQIDKNFDLFILDEFHLYQAPQICSVLNTMMLIRHTNRRKKFLFLSATPNEDFIGRLEKAGFQYQIIDPLEKERYVFPDTDQEIEDLRARGWRQVSRALDLEFVSLTPSPRSSEEWLRENGERILTFLLDHPGSKGAIILNSVASVKRLLPYFQALLAPQGWVVGENTGLTGRQAKDRSLETDLVLGTSTIDVGVDFRINFLIFESSDAGNFIQRLGRLGRHDGYWKEGQWIPFQRFSAIALTPNYLVERLFSGNSPVLISGELYERPYLQDQIRAQYGWINDFRGYYKRWGAIQSAFLCSQLGNKTIRDQYADSRVAFLESAERAFDVQIPKLFGLIKGWSQEWREQSGKTTGNPIAEEAVSFRGSTPFQCGLYDLNEEVEVDRFKIYSLPGILSNLEIEVIPKTDFLQQLQETAERTEQLIPKGRFEHCLLFLKLLRYREERLNWRFDYKGDLSPHADRYQVQVLRGIEVWQPDNPWIGAVNPRLRKQGWVCYVLRRPVAEVRSRLRLPMHFQIYPIGDRSTLGGQETPYSIAFGQSALLLDTLAFRLRSQGEVWIA